MDAITLNEEAKNLDEVTVAATKPLFELEMGKMVVNVSNSVTSAGLSVIDVLEKSPGVLVNRQNNSLSLSGKKGGGDPDERKKISNASRGSVSDAGRAEFK